MAENIKFEVGQRLREIDGYQQVLVIELRCPLCAAGGKTDPVAIPATRAWRPNFSQLEEKAKQLPALSALFEETEKGKRARLTCGPHGQQLRKAGIWTDMFHLVLERARERRQQSELSTIATLLGGEQVEAVQAVGRKVDRRRGRAVAKTADSEARESEGRRPKPSRKPRRSRRDQEEGAD